jgi:asparagine synthase (glutamine-hydrolysing)
MCGVVGYFSLNQTSRDNLERDLRGAVAKLHHRGPDGKGEWINESHTAALGHARLSIVDVEGGKQPFSSEDGSIVLVANGEFYGYKDIRAKLIAKGYKFHTGSDCEILIPLYQEYGLSFFDHMNGEFAFILYDRNKKRIIAARDRFGIKPLFYHRHLDELFFGSEIKAILQFGVEARWNPDCVMQDDFFVPNASSTYFKNVHAVTPAHYLLIENGEFHEKPYWDFQYDHSFVEQDEATYIDELKELLDLTVKTRLHGDVPVGCYVSGGIDSSTIVSLAKKLYDKPVTSFTIKFANQAYDESHLSRKVAAHNDVDYVEVEVNEQLIADNYKKAIWHNEGLIYNAQGVAKYLLSQKVSESGYKVVLTGEGADEIFAGYPFFREDMGGNLEALKQNNQLISGAFLSDGNYESTFQDVLKEIGHVPAMWKVGAKFATRFMEIYTDNTRHDFSVRNPYNESIARFDTHRLRKFSKLNKSLYLWSKTKLPQVILSFLGDRMEMANSVEGRLPFLDHRMVEFAQKLPCQMKINDLIEKYVLREAAKDMIPDFIYNRQKFPFTAPPIVNAREEGRSKLHEMTLDYLNSTYASLVPFYNPAKVEILMDRLMDQPLHERGGADPIINRILSAAVLSEQFGLVA